jgi:hypothetical protein
LKKKTVACDGNKDRAVPQISFTSPEEQRSPVWINIDKSNSTEALSLEMATG